jgi:hypothetical protein
MPELQGCPPSLLQARPKRWPRCLGAQTIRLPPRTHILSVGAHVGAGARPQLARPSVQHLCRPRQLSHAQGNGGAVDASVGLELIAPGGGGTGTQHAHASGGAHAMKHDSRSPAGTHADRHGAKQQHGVLPAGLYRMGCAHCPTQLGAAGRKHGCWVPASCATKEVKRAAARERKQQCTDASTYQFMVMRHLPVLNSTLLPLQVGTLE